MQIVATNVRFPMPEYTELKELAFVEKKSIAALIRDAVRQYKEKNTKTAQNRLNLFGLMVRSRVKIRVPTTRLVVQGRKFE